MKGTFDVRGRKVRVGSERRYVAVLIETAYRGGAGILKRTDSLAVARAYNPPYFGRNVDFVIIDTETGQEVQ